MTFLAPFITPILAALRWLGTAAFTGMAGATVGGALLSGFVIFLARAGISVVVFTAIATATGLLLNYALAQSINPQILSVMQATGMTVGINIVLSTLQSIIAIRVIKVGFRAAVA